MNKFLLTFILLYMVSSPSQIAIASSSKCHSVSLSAHPNYPPFHWKERDTLVGASIDISGRIFENLGIDVKVSYEGPWKRVLMSIKQGKIDFIPALKKTSERQEYLEFTQNEFATNPVAIFVKKGRALIPESFKDLVGLHGSVNAGDKHGYNVDSFISSQSNIQFIHGLSQNFGMLILGRTDYFITGFYTGYDFLKANKLDNQVEVAFKIHGLKIHNGFTHQYAKECQRIVKEFDRQLSLLSQNGEIEKSITNYHNIWLRGAKKT